jgi:hypothetical protein
MGAAEMKGRKEMIYYFKIDSATRTQFAGVVDSGKFRTVYGVIDAQSDLQKLLNPNEERIVTDLPRKPAGCEWESNFKGQRWAIRGWKK